MVPVAPLPPTAPFTCHVTVVFVLPVTVASNASVALKNTLALVGVIATVSCCCVFDGAPVTPVLQPAAATTNAASTTRKIAAPGARPQCRWQTPRISAPRALRSRAFLTFPEFLASAIVAAQTCRSCATPAHPRAIRPAIQGWHTLPRTLFAELSRRQSLAEIARCTGLAKAAHRQPKNEPQRSARQGEHVP
jgi:hypothetical protein